MRPHAVKWCVLVFGGLLLVRGPAVLADPDTRERVVQHPDSLVRALYAAVSFERGTTPDWQFVRSLFDDRALVVLRVARDSTAILSVDEFVRDFVNFIRRVRADTTGFRERVLRVRPMILGNIAHILVLYEASIPTSTRPPQQGIDSFHLVRNEGRWWVTSVVNEVINRDRPVPGILRE